MGQFLANNLFVSVLKNATLGNVTTTKIFMMKDVNVNLNVKLNAGIGSCARIIAKMNVKALNLHNVQKKK